jgi:rod shape-determining protein MreD
MVRLAAIAAAAVVAVVLQSTVFARLLPLTGVIPNFVLVLVVMLGVEHQGVRGVAAAFGLGYVLDTFVGTTLGLHALAFTVVYTVVVGLAQTIRIERGATAVIAVGIAGIVHAAAAAGIARLAHGGPPFDEALRHGLVETLITAALSPAVFAFVAWQEQLLGVEP